jgi:hypothetical protein
VTTISRKILVALFSFVAAIAPRAVIIDTSNDDYANVHTNPGVYHSAELRLA